MRSKKKPGETGSGDNTLRIIGGQWRGRKLHFSSQAGLRPTGDRVRETLFNWLAPRLSGACCLDLFAGSGALGLEALSRGAATALLIDSSAVVCRTLRQHRQTLGVSQRLEIRQADALCWLPDATARPQGEHHFDVVFIDPPFQSGLLNQTLARVDGSGILNADALIYVEHRLGQTADYPQDWRILRARHAGQVSYQLLEKT